MLEAPLPILWDLNAKGLSVLPVEQMASFALAVTGRTFVMENGRVLFSGSSSELAHDNGGLDAYLGRKHA